MVMDYNNMTMNFKWIKIIIITNGNCNGLQCSQWGLVFTNDNQRTLGWDGDVDLW
jgi:hypothetical protein